MQDESREWHGHVITAYRMTDSQFTELQGIQSVAVPTLEDLVEWVTGQVIREIHRAMGKVRLPGVVSVIPEALHFNIELANVEKGRSL